LSKIAMDRILRDFADSLPDANLGLFFYAGHGVQVSGENYLVPIDARLET
ncbi:caspase family protein, partial [Vibrio parahaemolyticus]